MVGGVGAGPVDQARHQGRAAAVDDDVGERRGDDLAAQPVPLHRVRELLPQRLREVALQLAVEIRVVRHGARRGSRRAATASHRRAAPRIPAGSAPRSRRSRSASVASSGRNSTARSSRPSASSACMVRMAKPVSPRPPRWASESASVCSSLLRSTSAPDLVGHRGQQGVARRRSSSRPSRSGIIRAILMLTSTSEVFDAGRIVDGVGVEPDARRAPPRCGRAGSGRDWRPRRRPWRAAPAR